jgi:hypothetical protein
MHGRSARNVCRLIERARECGFYCAKNEIVHELRITEANLELRRVRVDVDAPRVERKMQHVGRLARLKQHVLVAEPNGVPQ